MPADRVAARFGVLAQQVAAGSSGSVEAAVAELPVYTLEEVAEHRTRSSCWVALHGDVYDFTPFLNQHPGGARGLLRHAGLDASDAFTELHSQSIFAAFAPRYRIGRLAPPAESSSASAPAWDGVGVSSRFWEGLLPHEGIVPDAEVLKSPFPHTKFVATGLETFRFQWAVADRLLRIDESTGTPVPPADSRTVNHMIRQKSSLGVLNIDRDWLYLSDEATYAFEMNMRRTLLLEDYDDVYVTDPSAVAAEAETLAMAIEFLLEHFPHRFQLSENGGTISTTTKGYEHSFKLASFAEQPLRLLGMLIQEDVYLQEQELPSDHADLPPLPRTNSRSAPFPDYQFSDHIEEHPSGKQHIFLSAVSTFSFEAKPRHKRSMASIHNPNVDRWYFHLQRGMNRLFSEMTPEISWYRHNYGFHDGDGWSGVLSHGFDWADRVVPGLREEKQAAKAKRDVDAKARQQQQEQADARTQTQEVGGLPSKRLPGMWGRIAEGGDDYIRDKVWHRIEFQTLRRLPTSKYICFTVRTIADPMSTVEKFPGAAGALAAHIRRKQGLPKEMDLDSSASLLPYLDRVSERAGLRPGKVPTL